MTNYVQRPLNSSQRYNTDYKKFFEKSNLRKRSSGLGFYVLVYTLCMSFISIFLMIFLMLVCGDIDKVSNDLTATTPISHYYYIFTAVFSALIPGILYLLFSGNRISDCVQIKAVKAKTLLPIIFIGLALSSVANIISDIVSTNFSYFGLENTIDFSESSSSLFTNILYVISTAIVPAFAEEFAFRGILMGTLRKYGDAFAIITSSVMFGAMHGNIVQIPFAFVLGLIFAYVDCKTNSIIPSVIIHFLNNFYAVIIDILSTEGILSDKAYFITYYIIVAAFCVLGILSFMYLSKKDKQFFAIGNNSCLSLSLKEKNICFFTNPGVVLALSIFALETITYLAVI